jgi:hypothetical protein
MLINNYISLIFKKYINGHDGEHGTIWRTTLNEYFFLQI